MKWMTRFFLLSILSVTVTTAAYGLERTIVTSSRQHKQNAQDAFSLRTDVQLPSGRTGLEAKSPSSENPTDEAFSTATDPANPTDPAMTSQPCMDNDHDENESQCGNDLDEDDVTPTAVPLTDTPLPQPSPTMIQPTPTP